MFLLTVLFFCFPSDFQQFLALNYRKEIENGIVKISALIHKNPELFLAFMTKVQAGTEVAVIRGWTVSICCIKTFPFHFSP